ncbi:hypothetical protein K438DRAFT_1754798 [Mycena galopus ATCC 62051]|nr:hypothetical protein K438DRAFT_1754798 [Mycena galopus ATCC 62051]
MQLFPLLLQFALLVFSAALSTYLWTIHPSIAIIVLSFTSLGVVLYILLLACAAFADSPFQTPLAQFVVHLFPESLRRRSKNVLWLFTAQSWALISRIWAVCSSYIFRSGDLLPCFSQQQAKPPKPERFFENSCFKPSSEVSAVSWILETSTDPIVLANAADVAIDLQWPVKMDIQPHMTTLWENFVACFEYAQWLGENQFWLLRIRDGMEARAIQLGRAYHIMRSLDQSSNLKPEVHAFHIPPYRLRPELQNAIHLLASEDMTLNIDSSENMQWLLRVLPLHRHNSDNKISYLEDFLAQLDCSMPGLDCVGFSHYLFCVYAFLSDGDISHRDITCMDKSSSQDQVFEQLLNIILAKLKSNQIRTDLVVNLIQTTHKLANINRGWNYNDHGRRSMIYQFCSSLPQVDGWVQIVLAMGLLTPEWVVNQGSAGAGWVYEALKRTTLPVEETDDQHTQSEAGVAGLLLALYHYDTPPLKEHVHHILRVLSSNSAGHVVLLLLQENVLNWFSDPELGPTLQNVSVWTSLSHWIMKKYDRDCNDQCILLGHALSEIPGWQPQIQKELGPWIILFFDSTWALPEKYNSVLTKIWGPATGGYSFINPREEAFGLTYAALSSCWDTLDFSMMQSTEKVASWLRCTSLVVLCKGYKTYDEQEFKLKYVATTRKFKECFSLPVKNSLLKVAAAARFEISSSRDEHSSSSRIAVVENIVEILEYLANKMAKPTDGEKEVNYWDKLHSQVEEKIEQLDKLLSNRESATVG